MDTYADKENLGRVLPAMQQVRAFKNESDKKFASSGFRLPDGVVHATDWLMRSAAPLQALKSVGVAGDDFSLDALSGNTSHAHANDVAKLANVIFTLVQSRHTCVSSCLASRKALLLFVCRSFLTCCGVPVATRTTTGTSSAERLPWTRSGG